MRIGPSALMAGLGLLGALVGALLLSGWLSGERPKARWPALAASAASAEPAAAAPRASRPRKAVAYAPGPVENGGTIRVKTLLAKAPEVQDIPLNKDQPGCGHTTMTSECCVFDPATLGLANCAVGLQSIAFGKEWTGELAEAGREVLLDQKSCRYEPHVMLVRAGARVGIQNSDPVEHNVHTFFNNRAGGGPNFFISSHSSQPPGDDTTFKQAGNVILRCDIHSWMSGYIRVAGNPYWVITGKDGLATLSDVPPGQYTLACWHEGMRMTVITKGALVEGYEFSNEHLQQQIVTVPPGGTVDVTFTLEPK